ncbi:hypothetical protein EDB92DRAFT_1490314 [Lactarius akahatsu]|uniref:Uncharacterized protein n=1 Tax=Lactarius akahatsu TaxID=416441 RepID=A0AAD4QA76_9AGAM|nr:hypothetical protein EDB92DRAFT_1490314 [Lactarius akahatsu]
MNGTRGLGFTRLRVNKIRSRSPFVCHSVYRRFTFVYRQLLVLPNCLPSPPLLYSTTIVLHRPSFIMKVWLLLVDYKFQAIGHRFEVNTTSGDFNINDLKKGVGEKRPNALSRASVDCSDLIVWKTMIIDRSTAKRLAEILRDINVDDKDTIEKLSEDEQVADLGLSEGQTLLVRQPARAPELKEFKPMSNPSYIVKCR